MSAPRWFTTAFKTSVDAIDYGKPYAEAAEACWAAVELNGRMKFTPEPEPEPAPKVANEVG